MEVIKKLWQNFKTRPDSWFFYGFLLTFPLTIRKVLLYYPIGGTFNEYTGIYLYLSDIFLILTLIFWVIPILCNKNSNLSIYKSLFNALSKPLYILPLLLVVWSFISTLWSQNTDIALFRSFKLLEFYLLYIYITSAFSPFRKGGIREIFKIILFLALFEAIIAIFQFVLQHSIGLFWLKESLISADLPGVAKIIFNGHKLIRVYGLFPHPNILGGFLVFSILVALAYKKMFFIHSIECSVPNSKKYSILTPHNVPRETFAPGWNNLALGQTWNIYIIKLLPLFVSALILALILTFSKSAILGLLIGSVYMFYKANIPKDTLTRHLKVFLKYLIVLSLILVLLAIVIKPDFKSFFIKSLSERILYLDVSPARIAMQSVAGGRETIKDYGALLFGIGSGQSVSGMQNLKNLNLETWQFQPVHNVFLLIWAELGFLGLFIFISWLWKLFHVEHSKDKICHPERIRQLAEKPKNLIRSLDKARDDMEKYIKAILLAFIFIMLFDHYFWDIQQGQIMLWFIFGSIVTLGYSEKL